VYHPVCIKRDESFFRVKGKWDCGELLFWTVAAPYLVAVISVMYTM
jgi:hypothetical protein